MFAVKQSWRPPGMTSFGLQSAERQPDGDGRVSALARAVIGGKASSARAGIAKACRQTPLRRRRQALCRASGGCGMEPASTNSSFQLGRPVRNGPPLRPATSSMACLDTSSDAACGIAARHLSGLGATEDSTAVVQSQVYIACSLEIDIAIPGKSEWPSFRCRKS